MLNKQGGGIKNLIDQSLCSSCLYEEKKLDVEVENHRYQSFTFLIKFIGIKTFNIPDWKILFNLAVEKGHSKICQLIFDNMEYDPKDYSSDTPLDIAARKGHVETCQVILENVGYLHSKYGSEQTPLQFAKNNNAEQTHNFRKHIF